VGAACGGGGYGPYGGGAYGGGAYGGGAYEGGGYGPSILLLLCLVVEHMEVVGMSTDRTDNDMAVEVPPEPEVQQGEYCPRLR
jgi:hypothetical protein